MLVSGEPLATTTTSFLPSANAVLPERPSQAPQAPMMTMMRSDLFMVGSSEHPGHLGEVQVVLHASQQLGIVFGDPHAGELELVHQARRGSKIQADLYVLDPVEIRVIGWLVVLVHGEWHHVPQDVKPIAGLDVEAQATTVADEAAPRRCARTHAVVLLSLDDLALDEYPP